MDSRLLVEIGERARAYAARIVDRHMAEDIAQDVVLICLERMCAGTWRLRRGGIDGYVRCVVRRRAVDVLRRRQRRGEREAEYARERGESVHAWMDPEHALDERELEVVHACARARLPESCLRAYRLVREQRTSHAVAAAVLGVTVGAVKMGLVRAQEAMRMELARRGIEAPKGRRHAFRGAAASEVERLAQ